MLIKISFRRHHLDNELANILFFGKVIDIGGKKDNKRGRFRPPLNLVDSWEYCNIDSTSNPDILCSADEIPVKDSQYDIAVFNEVIEHVKNPFSTLEEIHRILKPGGTLVLSMPFLVYNHADPHDYQRWTKVKLASVLEETGFHIEKIDPMGGIYAMIYDNYFSYLGAKSKFRRRAMKILSPFFAALDNRSSDQNRFTTGWFVTCKK